MADKKGLIASDFGRDELNALLGGGLPEIIMRPTGGGGGSYYNRAVSAHHKKGRTKDVADMTVEETAAMILEQQKAKVLKVGAATSTTSRLRADTKKRNYHALLDEQQKQEQQYSYDDNDKSMQHNHARVQVQPEEATPPENEEFIVPQPKRSRVKATPLVVELGGLQSTTRDVRRSTSSSKSSESDDDSDDDDSQKQSTRRRRRINESSDSDDSSTDRRRSRLLQQRKQRHEAAVILSRDDTTFDTVGKDKSLVDNENEREVDAVVCNERNVSPPAPSCEKCESHSSGEGTSSDETASSDSSSDDESIPEIVKPVFVPKHRRDTIRTLESEALDEETNGQIRNEQEDRRKRESRAMVQQIVTAKRDVDDETAVEGIISQAMNKIPDDKDDDNDLVAREEWEVRELERLLEDWDLEQDRLQEKLELARRRKMTDDERLKEDADRIQGQKSEDRRVAGQKFYHRGAFYMDESEWDRTDVRHKAAAYARAATGDDKRDRTQLPKVMQVKRFGFANQTKYRGLAAEDTTDKQMDMLPFHRKK